ncbi:MAG: aspartyl protease family protein [Gammaproteobacteria bacterium]|nr:aspartyl protease family protein [Gammaproteobacteria bacterium]
MRSTVKALILLAALLMSGCASVLDENGALAMVPYKINDDGFIVIEASVNQQGPFSLALDSGATISSIFDPLRDELGLDAVPGKRAIVHGAVAKGEFQVLDVERIAIGNEQWIRPRVVSLPGKSLIAGGIEGLLGVDFLRQYAVSFSATERVIRLYLPERVEQSAYQGWATIPLRTETIGDTGAALYFFDVEVDGHEISAAFDLGAGLNLMNWAGAKSLGVAPGGYRSKREFSGALDSMPIAARLTSDVVRTANVRWKDEEFSVADLEIFATLGRADRPTAILGVGLFTQRDFIIDLVRNRLLIKRSMDEIVAPEFSPGQEPN